MDIGIKSSTTRSTGWSFRLWRLIGFIGWIKDYKDSEIERFETRESALECLTNQINGALRNGRNTMTITLDYTMNEDE